MDTTYLKTFQRVIETGSFITAARELGYAQSTVTGHVKLLERLTGRHLIHRKPSGAVPTEAGARLLRHAESLLRQEREMLREVREAVPRSTTLRLAAPGSSSAYRLPPLLAALARTERPIRVSVTTTNTAGSLAAVRRGAVDAALVIEPNLVVGDLVVRRLGPEPVHVVAGHADSTVDQPVYLLPEPGCCYGDDLADQLTIEGTLSSRVIRMNSIEAIKRCCVAGMGRAVLPTVAVREELERGVLKPLDSLTVRPASSYLVYHPGAAQAPAVTSVAERLSALWEPDALQQVG